MAEISVPWNASRRSEGTSPRLSRQPVGRGCAGAACQGFLGQAADGRGRKEPVTLLEQAAGLIAPAVLAGSGSSSGNQEDQRVAARE